MTDTSTPDSSVSADSTEAAAPEETAEETKKSESATTDSDLFRQSEIAADYVEGLLDILDYDGDIDELVSAGRPMVEVVGGRLWASVTTIAAIAAEPASTSPARAAQRNSTAVSTMAS